MQKFLLLALLIFIGAAFAFGQGAETFTNIPTASPTSYAPRSWTGDNGQAWSATDARTDQTITGKAITVRLGALTAGLSAAQTAAGIGSLTISAKAPFGSPDVGILELFVNGVSQGTKTTTGATVTTVVSYTWSGINLATLSSLSISQTVSGKRIAIDDLSWTSFASACTTPTAQATTFGSGSIAPTTATVSWTRGTGDKVLVIARATSAVATDPTDGTTYAANVAYGSGDAIGSGFVVYDGTGTSVNLTALTANTAYHFAIYEYTDATKCYRKSDKLIGNFTTLLTVCATPSAASSVTAAATSATTISGTFTTSGANNYLVVRSATNSLGATPTDGTTYAANAAFGSGTVVSNVSTGAFSASSLTACTGYYFHIFAYNNTSCSGGPKYAAVATTAAAAITYCGSTTFTNANGEAATISSLVNMVAPLSSTDGIKVWDFNIVEGGASGDVDVLPTIVNQIVFTKPAGNAVGDWTTAIESIALFDGTTRLATGTVTANNVTFAGAPLVSVADNTTKMLSVRLTLKNPLYAGADGEDFGFQISNGNVSVASGATSSGTAAFAAIATANAQNVIDVTATKLIFTQQPVSTAINLAMSSVKATAYDANGNKDKDFVGTVLLTSTGTMTGAPRSATAVAGVATYTNVIHTALGAGLQLTAASTGLADAHSTLFNIIQPTNLKAGDFAVVAFNTLAVSGAVDEICFVTFVDLTPGTSFDLTDNGYERGSAGKWGGTEGLLRFTITAGGATIPAGTVICIDGAYSTNIDYTVTYCGTDHTADFTISSLNTGLYNFDFNNSDQVWILTGGTWTNTTPTAHAATYTGGKALYGFTTTGWKTNLGSVSPTWNTSGSRMYPSMECFNTDVSGKPNQDKVKYTGSLAATTKFGWVARINDPANWTSFTSNSNYDGSLPAYDYFFGCVNFSINTATEVDGKWDGVADVNWFNCANWDTKIVPDATTNVVISATAPHIADIDDAAANAGIYNKVALCHNLTIENGILAKADDALDSLKIYGNLIINSGGSLSLGNATNGGNLYIKGDWTNNNGTSGFTAGQSKVTFNGTATQTLTTTGAQETFYDLTLAKTAATLLTLNSPTSAHSLTFASGILNADNTTNYFHLTNTSAAALSGYAVSGASDKYVRGQLRRDITAGVTYTFPVGDAIHDCQQATLNFTNANGATYAAAYYDGSTAATGLNYVYCTDDYNADGKPDELKYTMISGTWELAANGTDNINYNYAATILPSGANPGGGTIDNMKHNGSYVLQCSDAAVQTNGNNSATGLTGFSPFQLSGGAIVLPVKLLSLVALPQNNNSINVTWATATELNNAYFDLERSTDGKQFEAITRIAGNGTTNALHHYSFLDTKPATGINYYRLRQIDYDGKATVSPVVSAVLTQQNANLVINGNPVADELHATLTAETATTLTVALFAIDGKLIQTQTIAAQAGRNEITANTANLPQGSYLLKVTNERGISYIARFVKE